MERYRDALYEVLQGLPPAIRNNVQSYVASVKYSVDDIFRSAEVTYNPKLAEHFLFLVGIRKLWATVDQAYWTLEHSLGLTPESLRFTAGSMELSRQSQHYLAVRELHTALLKELQHLGVLEIVRVPTLVELLRAVAGADPRES